MKLGIFGGSFNPCHVEHVAMARAMVKELSLDKLIVVPAGIAPHKTRRLVLSGEDRIEMLKIAFADDKNIEVSDYEVKKSGVSYTIETLGHFALLYPDAKIFFLVGTDMLADFKTWKEPDGILRLATLCLVRREGDDTDKAISLYSGRFNKPLITLDHVGKDISSTAIRAKAALSMPLDGWVADGVALYIKNNGLYSDRYSEFVVKNLPIRRLTHTFGVMVLAVSYAKRQKADESAAFTAAMLHDAAKYLDEKDFGYFIPTDVPEPVKHQFLGAYIAQSVLDVGDKDVINAIRYHTTGRPAMSTLEKIIFLADLLEQGRTFPEVDELRKAVDDDFERGFKLCVSRLYDYLSASGQPVYYLTKQAKDYYENA